MSSFWSQHQERRLPRNQFFKHGKVKREIFGSRFPSNRIGGTNSLIWMVWYNGLINLNITVVSWRLATYSHLLKNSVMENFMFLISHCFTPLIYWLIDCLIIIDLHPCQKSKSLPWFDWDGRFSTQKYFFQNLREISWYEFFKSSLKFWLLI